MHWSKENVLYLLNLIRERPVIWDIQSRDYRDKLKRKAAMEEIALLLGCSVQTVKMKWISLKNQYSREKRNMRGIRTCSGADATYDTKWYAYKEIESLMDSNAPQQTCNNDSELSTSPPIPPLLRPPSTPTPLLQQPPSTPILLLMQPPPTPTSPPLQSPSRPIPLDFTKQEKTNNEPSSVNTDDLASFGSYIAAHLRKYNLRLQCKARYEINKILYTLDMQSLDDNSSGSSVGKDYPCSPDSNENECVSIQSVQQQASILTQQETAQNECASVKPVQQQESILTQQETAQKVLIDNCGERDQE